MGFSGDMRLFAGMKEIDVGAGFQPARLSYKTVLKKIAFGGR